jgi:hypothetical protein
MKFQISFVPDMAKDSYKLMHNAALDKYAAELVDALRGPADYLDIYSMMYRLDEQKFRIVNGDFMDFMTHERWVEYIKSFIAEAVTCDMTNYKVEDSDKILQSIKLDYAFKAIAVIELEIPDDFIKEENVIDAVFRDISETHESRVNELWIDSCVAKYSRVCVNVI